MLLGEALRFEVAPFNIKVSLVEPSYFRTSFGSRIKFARERVDAYEESKNRALQVMLERASSGGDPKVVAQTILQLIESPSPELHNFVDVREDLPRVIASKQQDKAEQMMRKYWNLG